MSQLLQCVWLVGELLNKVEHSFFQLREDKSSEAVIRAVVETISEQEVKDELLSLNQESHQWGPNPTSYPNKSVTPRRPQLYLSPPSCRDLLSRIYKNPHKRGPNPTSHPNNPSFHKTKYFNYLTACFKQSPKFKLPYVKQTIKNS